MSPWYPTRDEKSSCGRPDLNSGPPVCHDGRPTELIAHLILRTCQRVVQSAMSLLALTNHVVAVIALVDGETVMHARIQLEALWTFWFKIAADWIVTSPGAGRLNICMLCRPCAAAAATADGAVSAFAHGDGDTLSRRQSLCQITATLAMLLRCLHKLHYCHSTLACNGSQSAQADGCPSDLRAYW
jgi:hypothetical protein